jgi:hypothetical protein
MDDDHRLRRCCSAEWTPATQSGSSRAA